MRCGLAESWLRTELGRLEAQGIEQLKMPGGAGKPLLSPHYVADFHEMVVGHHCQMIGRKAVRLKDDEVFLQVVLPLNVTAN